MATPFEASENYEGERIYQPRLTLVHDEGCNRSYHRFERKHSKGRADTMLVPTSPAEADVLMKAGVELELIDLLKEHLKEDPPMLTFLVPLTRNDVNNFVIDLEFGVDEACVQELFMHNQGDALS